MKTKNKPNRIKSWFTTLIVIVGVSALIGGCVRIDYGVFKAKYPNAGVFDYFWSKGIGK